MSNEFQEQLNYYVYRIQSLPLKVKFIILLLINIGIVYYFYDTSIGSAKTMHRKMFEQKKSKVSELNSLLELKARFPQLQKEIDDLTAQLQQKLRKLPNDSEIPALLKTISKEAIKSGLKITSFVPEEEIPAGYFYKLPIKMEAEGTYHQMTLFCDKISKLPRIVNVFNTKLKVLRQDIGRSILSAEFEVHTFRFKEKVAAFKPSAGGKSGTGSYKNPMTELFDKLKKPGKK